MSAAFEHVGAPAHLANTWFAAVLRDGFALAATDRMGRFADIGSAVLRTLLAGQPLNRDVEDAVAAVMSRFRELDVHPDVTAAVPQLGDLGIRLVTLSNGSTNVAHGLLERAGILPHFERLLSAESAGVWKPSSRAYAYAVATCGVEPLEAMLVAVHPWDIDGAAQAGLSSAWVNRAGVSYPEHFSAATTVVSSLTDLADRLR
jgi:2-haloacid dehalogenase